MVSEVVTFEQRLERSKRASNTGGTVSKFKGPKQDSTKILESADASVSGAQFRREEVAGSDV